MAFRVSRFVRDVANRTVRQFDDECVFERRGFFDRKAEFDKDFAGQRNKRHVVAERNDLNFDHHRVAFARSFMVSLARVCDWLRRRIEQSASAGFQNVAFDNGGFDAVAFKDDGFAIQIVERAFVEKRFLKVTTQPKRREIE